MTIIETPPMIVIGLVGYVKMPQGLCSVKTIMTNHLSEVTKSMDDSGKTKIDKDLTFIKSHCTSVRILAQTQVT